MIHLDIESYLIFEQSFRSNPDKTGFSISVCCQKLNWSSISQIQSLKERKSFQKVTQS